MGVPGTASIFLAVILALAILLIVLYVCIVKGSCWCFKTEDGAKGAEYTAVDVDGASSCDSDTERADTLSDLRSNADHVSQHYTSEPDLNATKAFRMQQLPATAAASDPGGAGSGLAMSAYGDERKGKKKSKFRMNKKELKSTPKDKELKSRPTTKDMYTGVLLSLTVKHSTSDLYLLITIHQVIDLVPAKIASLTQVCVKLLFLPDKQYATKTKWNTIARGRIDQSFKFAAVKRTDLFRSALRFRVYGRSFKYNMQLGGEKFIGETVVQLADIAQNEGSLSTERPLGPKTRPNVPR